MKNLTRVTGKPRLIIGAPAYRLETDARHTAAVARLCARAEREKRAHVVGCAYHHSVPVAIARNQVLATALASDATHLLMVDTDVHWPAATDGAVHAWAESSESIVCFPCELRAGDRWNVLVPDAEMGGKQRWARSMDEIQALPERRSDATGAAMLLLNLAHVREVAESMPDALDPPFCDSWQPSAVTGKRQYFSEDVVFTGRAMHLFGRKVKVSTAICNHVPRGT